MQKVPNKLRLSRKVGPLPVYGYALLALAAWFLYSQYHAGANTATGAPVNPAVGSAAQQPASGQGSPASNGNSDLLSALGANTDSLNALLSAVQAPQGGGYGDPPGAGTSPAPGTDTAAVTAPTVVDAGVTSDPTPPSNTGTLTPEQSANNPGITGTVIDPGFYTWSGVTSPTTPPDALVGNAAYGGQFAGVTQPTPYATVTPSPVDTTSATVAPTERPTLGKPVMV